MLREIPLTNFTLALTVRFFTVLSQVPPKKVLEKHLKKNRPSLSLTTVFFFQVLFVSKPGVKCGVFLSPVKMVIVSGWGAGRVKIKSNSILPEKCKSP